MTLGGRLGALAERNFRLVFSSTTISAIGDGVAQVATWICAIRSDELEPAIA